jgi:magnesium transporter
MSTREHLEEPALKYAHRDFAKIYVNQTVGEALAALQRSKLVNRIVYFYVVDEEGRLRGVVPTRRLLLSPPSTPIADIMETNLVSLPEDATLLDACDLFVLHRLLALPIVDSEGRMVGVIDVDQYTEEVRDLDAQREADTIFQMIGVRVALLRRAPLWTVFLRRFPWLLSNITGGLACAIVAGLFHWLLSRVIALALFVPVALALAESVSIQSLTLALQLQPHRRLPWRSLLTALTREIPAGLCLGTASAALVASMAWLWHGDGRLALSLWLSITASVSLAALIGMLTPSVLFRLQRDPKVASGPLTLALADLATISLYLGFASRLLRE